MIINNLTRSAKGFTKGSYSSNSISIFWMYSRFVVVEGNKQQQFKKDIKFKPAMHYEIPSNVLQEYKSAGILPFTKHNGKN